MSCGDVNSVETASACGSGVGAESSGCGPVPEAATSCGAAPAKEANSCAPATSTATTGRGEDLVSVVDEEQKRVHNRFWEVHKGRFELMPVVIPMIARGKPVTLQEVAEAASWPFDEVEAVFAKFPTTDWDDQGRLRGWGMTQKPTSHSFTFDDQTVYGWCGTDVLILPFALGRSGVAESKCAATGQTIRIEMTPESVVSVEPASAVVSLVRPEVADDIRDMCNVGNFFAAPEAAEAWLKAYPAGAIHWVEEDFHLNRETWESFGWVNLLDNRVAAAEPPTRA